MKWFLLFIITAGIMSCDTNSPDKPVSGAPGQKIDSNKSDSTNKPPVAGNDLTNDFPEADTGRIPGTRINNKPSGYGANNNNPGDTASANLLSNQR
jgi:hypothetical protein